MFQDEFYAIGELKPSFINVFQNPVFALLCSSMLKRSGLSLALFDCILNFVYCCIKTN